MCRTITRLDLSKLIPGRKFKRFPRPVSQSKNILLMLSHHWLYTLEFRIHIFWHKLTDCVKNGLFWYLYIFVIYRSSPKERTNQVGWPKLICQWKFWLASGLFCNWKSTVFWDIKSFVVTRENKYCLFSCSFIDMVVDTYHYHYQ